MAPAIDPAKQFDLYMLRKTKLSHAEIYLPILQLRKLEGNKQRNASDAAVNGKIHIVRSELN